MINACIITILILILRQLEIHLFNDNANANNIACIHVNIVIQNINVGINCTNMFNQYHHLFSLGFPWSSVDDNIRTEILARSFFLFCYAKFRRHVFRLIAAQYL